MTKEAGVTVSGSRWHRFKELVTQSQGAGGTDSRSWWYRFMEMVAQSQGAGGTDSRSWWQRFKAGFHKVCSGGSNAMLPDQ